MKPKVKVIVKKLKYPCYVCNPKGKKIVKSNCEFCNGKGQYIDKHYYYIVGNVCYDKDTLD